MNPENLPRISYAAIQQWRAAGLRVKLIPCKGGYIVQVR